MKIAVTGASGLIGSRLCTFLKNDGHQVLRLLRPQSVPEESSGADILTWEPVAGEVNKKALEGLNAVVHLVGENVAQRWTEPVKKRITGSRLRSTDFLCKTLASLASPPEVLISASAIGFYGDRKEEPVDESSSRGQGFLAELCQKWEAAASPAAEAGIRVVNLRTGIVLSTAGGALAKMLPPFQLGAGGILGSGEQYMSWITMTDTMEAIKFLIQNKILRGPVNLVAPNPVTNHDFTKALGKALGRPTFCPVPAAVARMVMGDMADEMLLTGAKVLPSKLEAAGYKFRYPDIDSGLKEALEK